MNTIMKNSMKSRTPRASPWCSAKADKIGTISWAVIFCFIVVCGSGCDALYRLLQKEGAEERELLGEVVPSLPNPAVEEVQRLLKIFGYRPGNVDGQLGLKTRNAIEQFQKDNNLKPNRFLDQQTWAKLNVFAENGLVIKGEVNPKKVQEALKKAHFNAGPVDGKMGRRTQEAIKKFQRAQGLKADGTIGFQTLTCLAKYLGARESTGKNGP